MLVQEKLAQLLYEIRAVTGENCPPRVLDLLESYQCVVGDLVEAIIEANTLIARQNEEIQFHALKVIEQRRFIRESGISIDIEKTHATPCC